MAKKRVKKKKINPLVIERQDVVAEVRINGAEMIRLSRVKYEGNDYTFVDMRRFWRAYDDEGEESFTLPRRACSSRRRTS